MVKVLENKLIDLDVLPGQEQIDLQRKFREQMKNAKGAAEQTGQDQEIELPEGAQVVDGHEGAKLATQQGFQIPKEMLPEDLSDEQKNKARGFGGVIIDGSGKVISGLTGTVGGVLKGVGDTAGNAVYGLGKTGTGLVTGLADTAKAPFTANDTDQEQKAQLPDEPVQDDADAAADIEGDALAGKSRKTPRKIELRSGQGPAAAELGAETPPVET